MSQRIANKAVGTLVATSLALLGLAACSSGDKPELDVTEHYLKLEDGRTVHCIETVRIGSWSCDWENAK